MCRIFQKNFKYFYKNIQKFPKKQIKIWEFPRLFWDGGEWVRVRLRSREWVGLDQYLQMLTKFILTYINSADKLLRWLQAIKNLPPWAFLFLTDADSMYTNIDTGHAIKIISEGMDELSTYPDFLPDYPINAVKSAMETIMRTNHFKFGDMNFIQLMGTAMGTSAVCMRATIYHGRCEVKTLLPNI